MHYDPDGRFLSHTPTNDSAVIDRCRQQRDLALRHAMSLDEFRAATHA